MTSSPTVITATTINNAFARAKESALLTFRKGRRYSAANAFMREIVTSGLEHGFRDPGRAFKWLAKVATEEGQERFVEEMDLAKNIVQQNLLQTA